MDPTSMACKVSKQTFPRDGKWAGLMVNTAES